MKKNANVKTFRAPLQLKAGGEEGAVVAAFSTFDVVDKDGDVVLASAFTPGQPVPMCWSHDWSMPVGKGVILVEADKALFSGQFFTDTEAGQEAYKTVKAMGALQEWSWGFAVTESSYETRDGQPVRVIKKAQVFEVSPVLVGAGENTQTLAIKAAVPYKATAKAPEDETWSKPALADFTDKGWGDLSDAEKNKIAAHFAWSASMPPEAFGDLKLPHHRPGDGAVVWAGLTGCASRLNQAEIPAGDLEAVKAHLRSHYGQFEKDVPDVLKETAEAEGVGTGKEKAKQPESASAKSSDFATTFQQQLTAEQIREQRWDIDRAFWRSCDSILGDENLDPTGKLGMLRTSLTQFGEALITWAAAALAISGGQLDTEMMGVDTHIDHKDGLRFTEQADAALAAAKALVERSVALAATRRKEGRVLSEANRQKLAGLLTSLQDIAKEIDTLLAATSKPEPEKSAVVDLAYLERRLRASGLVLASATHTHAN